jgi:uncharacterized membrane protein YbhN (UPF0104 family)
MCVAASVVCGVLAPVAAVDGGGLGWGWVLILLIPIGVVAVHPAVFGRLLALGNRLTGGRLNLDPRPWPDMLRLIAWSIPTWVLLGGSSAAVSQALGYHGQVARIAFAAVAAWVIGFLAVPVPAGAGLREVIFIALCGLPTAEATAVAATARVLLILVDGVGGVLGLWYAQIATRAAAPARSAASTGVARHRRRPDPPHAALSTPPAAVPRPGGIHGQE